MLTIEAFRTELFQKLLAARIIEHERVFYIPKSLFSDEINDIRVFMDSEMQHLVNVYPYRVAYISCESDKDNLAFIDIIPDINEVNGVIMQTFYYYDCESHTVTSFVNLVKPKK